MRDFRDNKIGNTGARRQAAYAERQRARGRRQRSFWLTDEEAGRVVEFIEQMRLKTEPGPL